MFTDLNVLPIITRSYSNLTPPIHLNITHVKTYYKFRSVSFRSDLTSAEDIHLILMRIRIRILDSHWKKWIRIQVISLRFTEFINKKIIFEFLFYFLLAFLSYNLMNHPDMRKFYNLSFFKRSDLNFRSKKVRIFLRIRIY